jgi:hypothetical protein
VSVPTFELLARICFVARGIPLMGETRQALVPGNLWNPLLELQPRRAALWNLAY